MNDRGYVRADLVALKPQTPNIDTILSKFDKEHHHIDDQVRFTVEGEGALEIEAKRGEFVTFTAEPGDLSVILAHRASRILSDRQQVHPLHPAPIDS